jgi:inner membrane protein
MDPVTQGIVATTSAQAFSKKNHLIIASMIGFLAGLSPDIDIFIRSDTDPLLFLEYHRQFTHSLFFIPIGSLLCAIVFYYVFAKKFNFSFRNTYIFSLIGYATHGVIDSFTTYGTQLLWPFSNERIAWNSISVIDPLFTLPVIILCVITLIKGDKKYSFYAIAWMLMYQLAGFIQKDRAENIIYDYAKIKGHDVNEIEAKPSFANIVVWKVIYSDDSNYYVNAIKLGLSPKIYPGEMIKKLDIRKDFKWLEPSTQQAKDVQRFRWFSNNYLGISKHNKNIIYDIRFSSIPNEVEGLWGIQLDKNKGKDEHITYVTNRGKSINRFHELMKMIID